MHRTPPAERTEDEILVEMNQVIYRQWQDQWFYSTNDERTAWEGPYPTLWAAKCECENLGDELA